VGFMQVDMSASAAISLLQFCVQLAFTWLAYVIVRSFFLRDLFNPTRDYSLLKTGKKSNGYIGLTALILYSLIVLLPLYVLYVNPFLNLSSSSFALGNIFSAGNFITYYIIYFVAVCISLLLIVTLAYPLTVKDLPGRNLYKAFLLFVMVMGGTNLGEYLLVKDLGMIDTHFSQLVFGYFPIVSVFVIKSIFNSSYADLKEKAASDGRSELQMFFSLFIPKVWKPLVALGILQFVSLWGSFYSSLIFMSRPENFSPSAQLFSILLGGKTSGVNADDPIIILYAGIVSLPPILLFLVFRRFLTSEVLLSQVRKL
jgi:putative aldouronate transport system permease protein